MRRIASVRGFARPEECDGVSDAGDVRVIDNAGQVVGWIAGSTSDSEQLAEFGTPATEKGERNELLATLVALEEELLRTCVHVGELKLLSNVLRQLADEDEMPAGAQADLLDAEAAETAIAKLGRRERATLAREIVLELARQVQPAHDKVQLAADRLASIREKLFATNWSLVVYFVKGYAMGLDPTLALMAGSDGLNEALDRFDPTRGTQFSTYAQPWIRQKVNRTRQNHSKALRLPVHAHDQLARYVRAERATWEISGGPRPTLNELTGIEGISATTLARIAEWRRFALSAHVGVNFGRENLAEMAIDPLVPSPADGGLANGYINHLEPQVTTLCERAAHDKPVMPTARLARNREVLSLRLGLGMRTQTLSEIGDRQQPKISRERVRQVEAKLVERALKQLQLSGVDLARDFWDWKPVNE